MFRVLAVADDFTRECLALIVDNSLSGIRVARELDRIVERRGPPCLVTSDNGTNERLLANLAEARRIMEPWGVEYCTARPHSSPGGLTPTEFAARPSQVHNQNGFSL
jgi:putative transposase